MRIQEVCEKTGLTKKAVYFYIDEGLIAPSRQESNQYLNFSAEDVQRLKAIALLRQLQMPVSDIQELFDNPSMTNYFLHCQLEALRSDLLQQLGRIRALSGLLTSLPPQYSVLGLGRLNKLEQEPTEADQSVLDLVCPDQDARMISIFIWSSFLNVPKSEYRLFLWGKMTEQAQKELKGSLRYVAKIIYALDPLQIQEDARQRYREARQIVHLTSATQPVLEQRILKTLWHLLENTKEQAYWKMNYDKVMIPLVQFVNGPLGELMSEYNPEYSVYLVNMQTLVTAVRERLINGDQRLLLDSLNRELDGKLDLERYAGLIGYYTFEMGLYQILPLEKQRQLLE